LEKFFKKTFREKYIKKGTTKVVGSYLFSLFISIKHHTIFLINAALST